MHNIQPMWAKFMTINKTNILTYSLSLIPRPLPDFISQLWRKIGCEIKYESSLGTRLVSHKQNMQIHAIVPCHTTV